MNALHDTAHTSLLSNCCTLLACCRPPVAAATARLRAEELA